MRVATIVIIPPAITQAAFLVSISSLPLDVFRSRSRPMNPRPRRKMPLISNKRRIPTRAVPAMVSAGTPVTCHNTSAAADAPVLVPATRKRPPFLRHKRLRFTNTSGQGLLSARPARMSQRRTWERLQLMYLDSYGHRNENFVLVTVLVQHRFGRSFYNSEDESEPICCVARGASHGEKAEGSDLCRRK